MVNNEVLNLCVVSAGFCRYNEREVGHKRHLSCLMVQRMLHSRIVSKLIGKVNFGGIFIPPRFSQRHPTAATSVLVGTTKSRCELSLVVVLLCMILEIIMILVYFTTQVSGTVQCGRRAHSHSV